eukprot:4655220-Prorocentrum_lima.AAC.1
MPSKPSNLRETTTTLRGYFRFSGSGATCHTCRSVGTSAGYFQTATSVTKPPPPAPPRNLAARPRWSVMMQVSAGNASSVA